ncbi:O-antigen ligase family protein [Desulfurobacterium sp.]
MRLKLLKVGAVFLSLSVYLLAFTIPLSIAGDNIAIGVGVLGLVLLLLGGESVKLPDLKPLTFFVVPEAVSIVLSQDFRKAWKQSSLNHHLFPVVLVYDRLKKGLSLERLLKFLSFSSLALAFSVIFEAFTHQNIKHFRLSRFHLFLEPVRAKGLFHQLTTGGVIFLLLFLFVGLSLRYKNSLYRLVAFFLFLSVILNQSRSYWIGMFVGLIFLFLLIYKRKGFFYFSGFFAIFICMAFVFTPLKARLESILNTKTNGSNTTRLIIWRSHYKAIRNDFSFKQKLIGAPVVGKDMCCKYIPESYEKVLGKKPPRVENLCDKQFYHCLSHNIYIKYLTDFGILGLIGYISFILYLVVMNIRGFSQFSEPLFAAFASMYAGFAAAGFFENNFTDAEVKICFMFILGINFYLLDKLRSGEKL